MLTWESSQIQGAAAITEKLVVSNCLMFSMSVRLLAKYEHAFSELFTDLFHLAEPSFPKSPTQGRYHRRPTFFSSDRLYHCARYRTIAR